MSNIQVAPLGDRYVAVVKSVRAGNKRIPSIRKECVMEGGLRFVLELTAREMENIRVLEEGVNET